MRIDASVGSEGLLTWRFTSLDPATRELTEDPLAGFLPPNVRRCSGNPDVICSPVCANDPERRCTEDDKNPSPCPGGGECQGWPDGLPCGEEGECIGNGEGEGSVVFTIMPKPGLPTGTEIRNSASIIFDTNEPIVTPEWLNTLDNTKPESSVVPLVPEQEIARFEVSWAGEDDGAGIRDYTIFFATNDDLYEEWLVNTTETSAVFTATRAGTYAFYSVARDLTGNVESPPLGQDSTDIVPDATTTVVGGTQRPGDCNQDGILDISDAICVFGVLFLGQPTVFPCGDGSSIDEGNRILLDWQPDGAVDISDGIGILQHLFSGAPGHALGGDCVPMGTCAKACTS